jgi:hypothetical protein
LGYLCQVFCHRNGSLTNKIGTREVGSLLRLNLIMGFLSLWNWFLEEFGDVG